MNPLGKKLFASNYRRSFRLYTEGHNKVITKSSVLKSLLFLIGETFNFDLDVPLVESITKYITVLGLLTNCVYFGKKLLTPIF